MAACRESQLAALRLSDTVDVEGGDWFVIDSRWVTAWITWCLNTSAMLPAPIDNKILVARSDPVMVKRDFRLVNNNVFELLTTWFGIESDSPIVHWAGTGAAAIGDRKAWRVEEQRSSSIVVELELLPHEHTKFCDRRERVCTAVGKFRERETVRANVTSASVERSMSWFRVHGGGDLVERIDDASGCDEYVLSVADIGCSVRAKLVSSDGTVWSAPTAPVEAAPPKTILSIEGDAVVGSVLHAKSEYWGGIEGGSEFWWIRVRRGKREHATDPATGAAAAHFTLGPDDAGCRFKVKCRPVRSDGMEGEVVTSKPSQTVAPPKAQG